MDIQYIHDTSMVLNRYITNYITKTDRNSSKQVWDDINKNQSLRSSLKSYALQSFKSRKLGAYEAADKLLGHSLYGKDIAITYLGKKLMQH